MSKWKRLPAYLRALVYAPVHTRANLEELIRAEAQRREETAQMRATLQWLEQSLAETRHELADTRRELAEARGALNQAVGDVSGALRDGKQREDLIRLALARIETRQMIAGPDGCIGTSESDLRAWEFQSYSQFGEDGILQYLIRQVPVPNRRFVEFGVEDYRECNTRLLLFQNRWSGLVLDGSAEYIARVREDAAYRLRDLVAVHAFIDRDNINDLLQEQGFAGELGLMSIDIDGNDYWVWERLAAVRPAIVIIEYNYRFGPTERLVVPYDPGFAKNEADPSAIYYGASLAALCDLGARKGYAFVGCSGGGVNAFFVRRDLLPSTLRTLSPEEGFVAGQHIEMRDASGRVVRATLDEQQARLLSRPLVRIGIEDRT